MLGSVEALFGLSRLAGATGTVGFGSDVYTRPPLAPQDSGLKLTPTSFTPQSGAKTRKHQGTTISYSDSEAGVTTLTIKRLVSGYRLGHSTCNALKPRQKRPQHSSACTLTTTVGSLTHQDAAGPNSFRFTGRLNGRLLSAGSYLLRLSEYWCCLVRLRHFRDGSELCWL
jgi:hypothetical protein